MRLIIALLLLVSGASYGGETPAERLAEAIRFETISYQDRTRIEYAEFERFHQFLRDTYPVTFGQLQAVAVNQHSLVIVWPGSDTTLPAVLFTAHMDVVPVEPGTEKDWQYPAFAGVVADNRIYGRGTLDDKQGLMGLMEAVESLLSEDFEPTRTLVLAFGHDEEIGGRQGAGHIAEYLRSLGYKFAWMVDEGGMIVSDNPLLPGRLVALVNVAEKGYLTLTLAAEGEGGHSSRPPKISTIGRLSAALERIETNPFPTRVVDPVDKMLETLALHMEQPGKFIFSNLWLTGSLVADQMGEDRLSNSYVRTTTALTMFNAGVKENVVPQRAEAHVNFRLLPGDTPQTVLSHIEAVVNDPSIDISYERWNSVPSISRYDGGGFDVISQAVTEVYPDIVVVPSLLTATTDTRHYIDLSEDQYRFHGMRISVEQASSVHGSNEFIDADSYEKSIAVARRMIELGAR